MLLLATILLSSLMTLKAIPSYTVDLPFSAVDLPNETTIDHYGQEIAIYFTMDDMQLEEIPDEESLQIYLEQQFSSSGASFITPIITYFPQNAADWGHLDVLFSYNDTGEDRMVFFNYSDGGGSRQVTQTCLIPEKVTLSVSSSLPLFPSSYDTRTIMLSGGQTGETYSLYCDDRLMSSVTASSASVTFGAFCQPGNYYVKDSQGYQVSDEHSLGYYDVFIPEVYDKFEYTDTYASGNGGYATAVLVLDKEPVSSDLLQLENWFNNRQDEIDFWPSLGQKISLEFDETDDVLQVNLLCPPNLGSSQRKFDTGMHLFWFEDSTLVLTQEGGGELLDYALDGTQPDSDGRFDITLTGSQLNVTYSLVLDGEAVRTVEGTGEPVMFRYLTKSGTYSVRAVYDSHTKTMTDTFTASIPDEAGGLNYIATDTFIGDGNTCVTDIVYYGGLGYPVQNVCTSFSGTGNDLVTGIVYDGMRRPDALVMLPYLRTGINSHYDPDHIAAQQAFYKSLGFGTGANAMKVNSFEDGFSGRLLTSMREGDAYRTFSKEERNTYRLNDTSDRVKRLVYSHSSSSESPRVTLDSLYAQGDLEVQMTISEDNDTSYVFSDLKGKVILERRTCDGTFCDTYYVYDTRDYLVCVIPPMGASELASDFSFDDEFVKDWCYTYEYDAIGNIMEKHIPGAGMEVMCYDNRGRQVLQYDSMMALSGLCRYTIFDDMDRITVEGYAKLSAPISTIRAALKNGGQVLSYLTSPMPLRQCTYYDTQVLPDGFVPEPGVVEDDDLSEMRCLTFLATETLYEEPYLQPSGAVSTGYRIVRTYFYDGKGRVVQMLETTSDGWMSRYSYDYSFDGKVLTAVERHTKGGVADYAINNYVYDDRGRLITCRRMLNDKVFPPITYQYDELGRLERKSCSGRVEENFSYNLQGWMTAIRVNLYNEPEVFVQSLKYYDPASSLAKPRYDGFLSEIFSTQIGCAPSARRYDYDGLERLVSSEYASGSGEYMSYDLNGNLLDRRSISGSVVSDSLSFVNDGNRILSSSGTSGESRYVFWPDGNLYTDSGRDLRIWYNFSNLPSGTGGSTDSSPSVRTAYLSDGTKAYARIQSGAGRVYRGNFVYDLQADGSVSLESVVHREGRFIPVSASSSASAFFDTWHVQDHIGSVRAIYDITSASVSDVSSVILEQSDYSPFGARDSSGSMPFLSSNRYRFNGKEEFRFDFPRLDTGLSDYGARHYSEHLSRWTAPDPLAEKYYSTSPYAFCNNNPVNYVDPDGRKLYFASGVSEKFKQQFAATVQFMNSKGTAGDLAELHASETVYYIGEIGVKQKHWNHFNTKTQTIFWDPNTMFESCDNIYVSPATMLAHEAAHAAQYDKVLNSNDPNMVTEYIKSTQSNPNDDYGSDEEKRVITQTEQSVARKHGEVREDQVTRTKHQGGRLIPIPIEISPDELAKIIFEHNNLL